MSLVIEPMPHDVDSALRVFDGDLPHVTAYAYRSREGVPEVEVALNSASGTYTVDEVRAIIRVLQAAVSEAEAAAR